MIIPSNANVQMKRRFSVDIANCNNMRKRLLNIGNAEACIWMTVPEGKSNVGIQVHILIAERQGLDTIHKMETDMYDLAAGVTVRVDKTRAGTKRTYSFQQWKWFEIFLSRLPSYMPSGNITYVVGEDGLPVTVDDFIRHLHTGKGSYQCVRKSRSDMKNLRYQMRNLGVAA